jgi:hypothetical protein
MARVGFVIGAAGALMLGTGPHGNQSAFRISSITAVITPRRTRLIRAADLHGFPRRFAVLATDERVRLKRNTYEQAWSCLRAGRCTTSRSSRTTHGHCSSRDHVRRASGWESAGAVERVDREAIPRPRRHRRARDRRLAFQIRPGLVSEMLRFYDQLRRQSQHAARFDELMTEALEGDATTDRGAERLLAQTRFLVAAFRDYERRVAASGACDEHLLRERLLSEPVVGRLKHVVITVADWIADPAGLFVADFDLLARIRSRSARLV